MQGSGWVVVAAIAFVGSHFLLSHPLRKPLVTAIGEPAFQAVYSLVAALTLGALVLAYRAAETSQPLWPVGNTLWAIATAIMLFASVLLMGSLVGNPALPGPASTKPAPAQATGVYAITRHPMMWSFARWGACHIAVYPVAKNIVVALAIIILALVGAVMQDRKKQTLHPATWPVWQARTSYWPFAAIASGRTRLGRLGMHALAGGLVVWLAATWAHGPLSGWAAGIWRWVT
jgi:uncharacterized membrane protein